MTERGLRILAASVLMLLLSEAVSPADIIYLKNGRKTSGVIKSETESQIILDKGFGSVTINKSDFIKVEKGDIQFTQAGSSDMNAPEGSTSAIIELGSLCKETRAKRFQAKEARRRHEKERNKLINIEKEMKRLFSKFDSLNEKLRYMSKDDILAYNNVIAEINSTSARLNTLHSEAETTRAVKENLDKMVSKYITDYNDALAGLEASYNKTFEESSAAGLSETDKKYFDSLSKELDLWKADFITREIPYEGEGSAVVVDVMLNNNVKVKMYVDTGAGIVSISMKTANALNIADKSIGTGKFIVADGREITKPIVILNSVNVEGSIVTNVEASISDEPMSEAVDGLLGMSYLSNFIVRVDANGRKLILEKFNPSQQTTELQAEE